MVCDHDASAPSSIDCRTVSMSSGVLAIEPTVAVAPAGSNEVTPRIANADTQSIASASPGGLSRSSDGASERNAVAASTSGSQAPGTRRRTISAARSTVGYSIQW